MFCVEPRNPQQEREFSSLCTRGVFLNERSPPGYTRASRLHHTDAPCGTHNFSPSLSLSLSLRVCARLKYLLYSTAVFCCWLMWAIIYMAQVRSVPISQDSLHA